jgi:hypothetical protein
VKEDQEEVTWYLNEDSIKAWPNQLPHSQSSYE